MSKKIYVVDTNVLMYAGKKALTGFEEHEVIIPFVVIEELEKKRNDTNTSPTDAFMARYALREIDALRESGKINEGIVINKKGGVLRVEMNHINPSALPPILRQYSKNNDNDTRVLAVANNLHLEEKAKKEQGKDFKEVILVTKDVPLRIKADSLLDLSIQNFTIPATEYDGIKTVEARDDLPQKLYSAGSSKVIDAPTEFLDNADDAYNHAFIMSSYGKNCGVALLRGKTASIANLDHSVQKLRGKSVEQKLAINYILDKELPIVSLSGSAGTGKTLISVATGMDEVARGNYNKVVVVRPINPVGGQEVGHLPGELKDKMAEWRKPIYDSVEGILDKEILENLQEEDKLDVMPVTFIRGRTFNKSFVIVDEAQNFEPTVLLTILSRMGYGSKIVFLWDATQKDNNRIGYNEGIISVVDKLKKSPMFVHIALKKSERSPVAELAGNILNDYMN